MSEKKILSPDYLFEVSWEICNKVGGIHTVIATKALNLAKEFKDCHILIGPDVWRNTERNPEFIEDENLLKSWRKQAAGEGLMFQVGRWNVAGQPIVILINFSYYITRKDEIFTELWKRFKLDSLNGQWDYVEPALFGYASGKVIESFVRFNLSSHQKAVAQFHEWMTGAGILYLKSTTLPIATVFTTHATVVGRSVSGNNLPLYDQMKRYNAEDKARELNVMSKHSLEKIAAHQADVFTTVSDITAKECEFFLERKVDVVTPNGFENSFTPKEEDYAKCRVEARSKMLEIASAMTGDKIPDKATLVAISGRYEYKNKGIDVFLDALGRLNCNPDLPRDVVAFLFVPAGHNGPNKELLNKLQIGGDYTVDCTHMLQEPEQDPIIRRVKELHLLNKRSDKVKVLFVPSYLNGDDGIFNMKYYQLLVGLDLTVFPSYYEPWGYTPLESLAFRVPTITTSLAGFGLWVKDHYSKSHPGIEIIERKDSEYDSVVDGVEAKMLEICNLASSQAMAKYRQNAKEISSIALWDNQIVYYKRAYSIAVDILINRVGQFPLIAEEKEHVPIKAEITGKPSWTRILVGIQLPERLKPLETMSRNLWCSWNQEVADLFKIIDEPLWHSCMGNPMLMLDRISSKRFQELERDEKFLKRMDKLFTHFNEYMNGKHHMKGPKIAYFSMEYGLVRSLKIYSGGLGILAGDYLKESSDKMIPMTGVGLLYRYGYFTQQLSAQGDQIAHYEAQDFMKIPVNPIRDENGKWRMISIAFPGRNLYARLWRVDIGRTELILMDTDFEDNRPEDRTITHHLYGGDWENRLKQELLLGIGGIRALRMLGKKADIYHCNEGHAAFTGIERLREYIQNENLSFMEAMEVVRASSLFTTHTPVPAGHDEFSEDLLRSYISHYPERLKTSWETLMALGKIDPGNPNEKFSMSTLAANISQEINGVSWLHGKVSQEIFAPLWPGYLPEELHVSYVTNGVHYPTWTAPEWKELQAEAFGSEFATHNYDISCFEGIYKVDNDKIWAVRNKLRSRLIKFVKHSLSERATTSQYAPHSIVAINEALRDDVLTIGFARRFATYKRAHLLFKNLDTLDRIVNNPKQPMQFIFAGKAHPADKAGQDLIKRIIEISLMPQFIGKILFIPDYDINVAKMMVQGVDVWMNTPSRSLEASGTSGEKAAMNGVMHFSVLDGWWVEGYKEDAGWALPLESTYEDQNFQDELDAATIYNMLENEVAPLFYKVNEKSKLPDEWIKMIKNDIALVAGNFTTNRMINDYMNKFYNPLFERSLSIVENDYAMAREIAFWKRRMRREWPLIEVRKYDKADNSKSETFRGNDYIAQVELQIGELRPNDIGVEIIFAEPDDNDKMVIKNKYEYEFVSYSKGVATYRCSMLPESAGVYNFATRIYAKNPKLPHRQDFDLVKWL